jgi:serine phosphatase RsbU (regulator of sigma subunit)/anti-sigma regulatory factor (Ser/Thr protein kinase)
VEAYNSTMMLIQSLRRTLGLGSPTVRPASVEPATAPATPVAAGPEVEIAPNDPLFAYLQAAVGPVDVGHLDLDSPALRELRAAGVVLVVPLVSQGDLIGTLNLGPRMSEQDYSSDDRRLLASLAAQAAPAVRVAQLVQEQAAEIQARERYAEEMRVATLIQQQFLPRDVPKLADWQVAAYYGPARAVGGDFYDFIELPDGRIGIVVGDVTDKGVPAALVMARTHSILRGDAPRLVSPSKVLEHANDLLVAEMPEKMFVTCLYLVLDPRTGHVVFANAGHNLPYVRTARGVTELRATGMPLGLLPGMSYEEREAFIEPDENVLLYSDGLVEAHDPDGDMYGFPRLRDALASDLAGSELLDDLLDRLLSFTGKGWEQEDDITLVTIRRSAASGVDGTGAIVDRAGEHGPTAVATVGRVDPAAAEPAVHAVADPVVPVAAEPAVSAVAIVKPADPAVVERTLLDLELPGALGNERVALERVAEAIAPLALEPSRLERLKTAVSEAAMNAIEYGSVGDPGIPVEILVTATSTELRIRITDHALGGHIPADDDVEQPDIDLKLAGLQKPRGWGLFLIRHMVDRVDVTPGVGRQTVTLTVDLEGASDGRTPA